MDKLERATLVVTTGMTCHVATVVLLVLHAKHVCVSGDRRFCSCLGQWDMSRVTSSTCVVQFNVLCFLGAKVKHATLS